MAVEENSMTKFIKVTDNPSCHKFLINFKKILSVTGSEDKSFGSKLDFRPDGKYCWLVDETPEQILKLIEEAQR